MASGQVTQLLVAWASGNEAALDPLMSLVYDELRRVARRHVARERPGILQPTALVHEAYLRLIDQTTPRWQNRAHFFAIAAQLMRRILVDHARARQSARRGGGAWHLSLGHADIALERAADVVALDGALSELAEVDPRKSRVVELRFFAGLSVEETATQLGVSAVTAMRDWNVAKAWLHRELHTGTNRRQDERRTLAAGRDGDGVRARAAASYASEIRRGRVRRRRAASPGD